MGRLRPGQLHGWTCLSAEHVHLAFFMAACASLQHGGQILKVSILRDTGKRLYSLLSPNPSSHVASLSLKSQRPKGREHRCHLLMGELAESHWKNLPLRERHVRPTSAPQASSPSQPPPHKALCTLATLRPQVFPLKPFISFVPL